MDKGQGSVMVSVSSVMVVEIKIRVEITVSKWSVVMYLLLMAHLRF